LVKADPTRTTASLIHDSDSLNNHATSNNASGEDCWKTEGVDQVSDSERTARELLLASAQPKALEKHRNYRTGILTAVVVALSLLLGWMVGRAGWNIPVNQPEKQSPEIHQEVLSATQMPQHSVPPRGEDLSNPFEQRDPTPVSQPAPDSATAPSTPRSNPASVQPDGSLIIHERGETNLIPVTNEDVLTRVVPRYPEEARQQRVQGPVVLDALVGTDGSVLEVQVISGDARLAPAATDAVRQWRFKSHTFKGKPTDFETHITVSFSLP
jgi:TonB family protein